MKSRDWIFEPTRKSAGDLILTSRGFVVAKAVEQKPVLRIVRRAA